eukprot:363254-Chlamydomonas_euryale.AAC.7
MPRLLAVCRLCVSATLICHVYAIQVPLLSCMVHNPLPSLPRPITSQGAVPEPFIPHDPQLPCKALRLSLGRPHINVFPASIRRISMTSPDVHNVLTQGSCWFGCTHLFWRARAARLVLLPALTVSQQSLSSL